MTTIKHAGHHGVVAIGVAATFTAAVFAAKFVADAVIFVGEWVMH